MSTGTERQACVMCEGSRGVGEVQVCVCVCVGCGGGGVKGRRREGGEELREDVCLCVREG